jgi:hypothetical protein
VSVVVVDRRVVLVALVDRAVDLSARRSPPLLRRLLRVPGRVDPVVSHQGPAFRPLPTFQPMPPT